VLDEPTIGLHPRDNQVLLDTLVKLRDKGNTLLVVEHDEDTILRADHVIDLGPGAGRLGGEVIAEGHASDLAQPKSITGQYLARPLPHSFTPRPPGDRRHPALTVRARRLHNLKGHGRARAARSSGGDDRRVGLRQVVTGARRAARQRGGETGRPRRRLHRLRDIEGWGALGRVLEVDQTPIGKTPRSCPATYIGFWDAIRKLYAETQDARASAASPPRAFRSTPARAAARCAKARGMRQIEMSFLPDVRCCAKPAMAHASTAKRAPSCGGAGALPTCWHECRRSGRLLRPDQVIEGAERRLRALAHGDDDLLVRHGRHVAGGEHARQRRLAARIDLDFAVRLTAPACPSASRCWAPGRSARTRLPDRHGVHLLRGPVGVVQAIDLLAVADDLGRLRLRDDATLGRLLQLALTSTASARNCSPNSISVTCPRRRPGRSPLRRPNCRRRSRPRACP
jgi:hypothetical protein